jgi:hypothetical protein
MVKKIVIISQYMCKIYNIYFTGMCLRAESEPWSRLSKKQFAVLEGRLATSQLAEALNQGISSWEPNRSRDGY